MNLTYEIHLYCSKNIIDGVVHVVLLSANEQLSKKIEVLPRFQYLETDCAGPAESI